MLDGGVANVRDKFADDRVLPRRVARLVDPLGPASGACSERRSPVGSPRPGGVAGAAPRRSRRVSDHYHLLAAPVPLFRVGERLRGLAERERLVDDRCQLAVLDDVLEVEQVRAPVDGGERDQPLAHEP